MIYRATEEHAAIVAQLAIRMWEDNEPEELTQEFRELLSGDASAVFLLSVDGQNVGFAQCQLRHDYVEGTESSPVGYLEGIFICESYRRKGLARELLENCEAWAREKGCTEFASDCELDNISSYNFHLGMGFEEANKIICFTKKL